MAKDGNTPKVGDIIQLPIGAKTKGTSSVSNEYEQFTYTDKGWVDSKGEVLDQATQSKINQAYSIPVGAMQGQYKYLGGGKWTDTNSYKGNVVIGKQAKELFLKEWEKPSKAKEYSPEMDKPQVPKKTSAPAPKGGGAAPVKTKPEPTKDVSRETPALEKIATKRLIKEPDIKQGSVKELVDTTGGGGGLKSALGKLSGLAEYAPDAFRMGLGLLGASEKVPEYEIPQEFMDYKSKLREMSTQGLIEQELANAYKDAERAYSYNVKGIRDMAGGRAGVGLANLGAATTNLGRAYEDINVADAAMRRQNLGMYGSALGTYMSLDRQQFEDKQQLALMNKQAGAQLAATALSDMQARADYNKTYGKGSIYEDYMKQMVEGVRLQNEMYQYQLDNPPDFTQGTFAPQQISTQNAVSPYTAPMFFYNPYFQQPYDK